MGRPQNHERDGIGGAQRTGWEGTGQAPPSQNSRTASGTRSHKMQNKKGGGMDMDSLGRGWLKSKDLQVTGTPVSPHLGTKMKRHASPPKTPYRNSNYKVTVPPDQAHHLKPKGEENTLKPNHATWAHN